MATDDRHWTLTIYRCPIDGCPSFVGMDDPDAGPHGDLGWNPDGWPRCPTHVRPMRPVKVIPVSVLRDEATVERVAEAIHTIAHEEGDRLHSWAESGGVRDVALAQARAALAAVLIEQGAPDA